MVQTKMEGWQYRKGVFIRQQVKTCVQIASLPQDCRLSLICIKYAGARCFDNHTEAQGLCPQAL